MSDAAKGRPEDGTIERDTSVVPPERETLTSLLRGSKPTSAAPELGSAPSSSPARGPGNSALSSLLARAWPRRGPDDLPLRRRAMPCPTCDAELPQGLAADPNARCPSCEAPLRPVEIAGFWRRAGAGVVDLGILLVTAGPLAWALDRLIDPMPLTEGARGLDRWLTLASTDFSLLLGRLGPFLVMFGLYHVVMLSLGGRTVGQRLLALRIVDRHGERPSVATSTLRACAQIAGTLAAALGLVWVAFDAERRAFHDHVAGTYVVRSA